MTDPYLKYSEDRVSSRQIDELIGLARGLTADGLINQDEVEFLEKWLAANLAVSDHAVIRPLYERVREIMADGLADHEEKSQLFETLSSLADRNFELGEVLKPAKLPLCDPAPNIEFESRVFCFTGTFVFGQRKACEKVVITKGAAVGGVTKKLRYLVVGAYATDSWKHSSMGNKIIKACGYRSQGVPLSIVSEEHWTKFL